jgi:ABC-type uncharacterized transport system permease subunit
VAIENWLDLVSAVLIFLAAIVPAYLSTRLGGKTRKLTIALTTFVVAHGTYHVVRMLGLESIADGVFEPASIIVLIIFGIIYIGVSQTRQPQETIRKS